MEIQRLAACHDRSQFDCGTPALNEYIQRLASQHDRKNIGRTYVLTEDNDQRVLGFYTIAMGAVEFENVPEEVQRKIPKHPIPILHLGRMGVDQGCQGQGFGTLLLMNCYERALRICDEVAIYAIEVIAKSDKAKDFYTKYGFRELLDDQLHLYAPMTLVKKIWAAG